MGKLQKIFLFGVDFAGKTSLSQALRTGIANPDNKPTKAFAITDLILKDFEKTTEFKLWDAPGQVPFRKTWGKGIYSADIMMFVLDTADKKRFQEAKQVLQQVNSDLETRNVPLIFLFHKMDLPEAKANFNEARELFKIPLITERKVYPLMTSVNDPQSIIEIKKTIGKIIETTRWG